MADLIQQSDSLNQGRLKLNEAIKEADKAKGEAGQAVSTSSQAKQIAEQANQKSDYTQTQLDQVTGASTIDPAVEQMKVGSNGTVYNSPDERVRKEHQAVTSQLTDNLDNVFKSSNSYGGVKPPATAVFIDDDGVKEVLTDLKPLVLSKNIPYTVALFSTSHILVNNLTDTLELQNTYGWEISAHTFNHEVLTSKTEEQLHQDSKNILSHLRSKGFIVNNLMYPQGNYNDLVQKVISKYYRSASTTGQNTHNNFGNLRMFRLNRIEIPAKGYPTTDFATLKGQIDSAYSNNSLIIFTTHIGQMTEVEKQLLSDVIDYVKTKGFAIKTMNDALDDFAPLIYSTDKDLSPNDYFILDRNGVPKSNRIKMKQSPTNAYLNNSPLTDYELNMTTVNAVNTASATGFPSNLAGLLFTYRLDADNSYGFQLYQTHGSRNYWIRTATSDGAWSGWFQLLDSSDPRHKILPNNSFDANFIPTSTQLQIMTYAITDAMKTGFPNNSTGIYTIYNIPGEYRAEFRPSRTNELWSRYVEGGAWTPWVKISAV